MSTILVVDDSLTVRMDLIEALTGAGLSPVGCASLAEARAAMLRQPIALAILDVRLPDGDGISFLEELRADPVYAELPILMLSSEDEVKDRIRGLRTGANDYIGKPYDTLAMIDRIRQLIGGGGGSDRLVLVIDDSPTFRAALTDALTRGGYTTVTAASGPEGLRVAAAQRPQAVIVDGTMPDMDGATVIRRIRLDPALRTLPCILLTGSEEDVVEVDALHAGADAFVRKESDVELILARLHAVLRAAHTEPKEPSLSRLSPRRLLLVDDDADYRDALADQLREEGYDVAQATCGEEALELLAVQPVDCILLDITMPGLSGLETCERIKAAPIVRDIPLIMVTSFESRDATLDGFTAGADDFVSKSGGLAVLKARVQAQVRRKQFEDEHRSTREQLLRSEHEASEARAARELAATRAALVEQLEHGNRELAEANRELAATNRELEAFSYSVSHDLRARVRAIEGYARALGEDAEERLQADDRDQLNRVLTATERMSELIEALLELSQSSRSPLARSVVDLSQIARTVLDELRHNEPSRDMELVITPGLRADADAKLMQVLLDNVLGNAWKYTSRRARGRIELGSLAPVAGDPRSGEAAPTFFVRDNGAGFDAAYEERLFAPFQRLHSNSEFKGTGIGLATVHRIIERHGGRIWAKGTLGEGATFYFTLPSPAP